MKKFIYVGIGLALCLLTVVWSGCDKPEAPKQPNQEQEKPVDSEKPVEDNDVGKDYVDTVLGFALSMVYVEGGTFSMGATEMQGDYYDSDELPIHQVTLDDFYIGAFEVTQEQWRIVMGRDPYSLGYGKGDNYPVYYVSWYDAVEFCEKLSAQTGKKYRLPTEAEWEYAARGGQYHVSTKYAGSNSIDEVAWFGWCDDGETRGNSNNTTHPVGQKKPNGLGLYDMSGNVWEWCSDWYDSDYYNDSQSVNPQGPISGSRRVYRGGYLDSYARSCRVSNRDFGEPTPSNYFVGLRVVCER